MKDEALKLALEALKIWEQMYPKSSASPYRTPAITAIEKALAQPAQEPVGRFAKFTDGIWREVTDGSAGQPLYTAPPKREWVDLTYEDWKKIENMPDTFYQGVAWAQAKLKEKNNGT